MSKIRNVKNGDVLLKEGEVSKEAFMLLKGKVAVLGKSENNQDILLAELGEGEVFGEMSLIESSPCSATVKAVSEVQVQVLTKENFILALQKDADTFQTILGSLFHRLRTMNKQVVNLKDQLAQAPQSPQSGSRVTTKPTHTSDKLILKPLTPQAKHAMDDMDSLLIDDFPYQIGRWSREKQKKSWFSSKPLENQLNIHDIPPYMVSREHCRIEKKGKQIYLTDLDSRLGTWVNGNKIGRGSKKKVQLESGMNTIYLGERDSLFSFEILVP